MDGPTQFSISADDVDRSVDDRLWIGRHFSAIDTGDEAASPASGRKAAGPAALASPGQAEGAPAANPIPDQTSLEDEAWTFQLPAGAFTDPDGDPLTLTATLATGDPLPDWLSFDAGSRTFTGVPPKDFNGELSLLVTASDGGSAVSSGFSLSVLPVNDAPVVTPAPIYASDFESPDDASWFTTIGGDSLIPLAHEDDGTGNATLVSAGPWWTDLNHVSPGAGQLHLPSTLYVNGSYGGIVIDDLRDLTFSFDIKAEGLELPDGAHIYLWFQVTDPTLPWGVGQYVNYVNVSVPVEQLLIDGAFAHVSITLSQVESDWLTLGSSLDREGDYSQSSSIVTALSGIPINLGLVVFMGNEPSGPPASGLIRLDNVVISHGEAIRLKFGPEALAGGLQSLHLDVAVADADTATFENYRLSVGYRDVGLSGEELGLAFSKHSDLTVLDGVLYLGEARIGTVAGGSNGGALLIEITAAVDSAVIGDVIDAIAYGNDDAVAGATRALVVTLDDAAGGTASFAVEIIARLPLDDGSGNDHLIGTGANETLKGGLGTDWLEGAAGDDRLDGGTGDDTLHGGTGDDWFYVDSAGDIVIESIGEGGQDRIFASVSYVLAAGAEIELLTTIFNAALEPIDLTGNELANAVYGNAGDNRLEGGAGNDALIGNEGDDSLEGGTGNDFLDGGAGADSLRGGIGDDWHFVDSAGDIVIEGVGEGLLDRIFAKASYTLAAGVEIELMSTSLHIGLDAIDLTGNELANLIYGNAGVNRLEGGTGNDALLGNEGDDILDGGTGDDVLVGGAGNDIFRGGIGDDWHFVDGAGDIVIEAGGEGMLDRVFASASYTLAAGVDVEMMSTALHIGFDAIDLTGNELANLIYGNAGANRLEGGAGNDALLGNEGDDIFDGGAGDDIFVGGIGRDTFLFPQGAGTDRVLDFSVAGSGPDLIALSGLGTVTLAAFIAGHVSQIGADAMISWNGAELILTNVNAATLLPDHFVLV